MVGKPFLFQQLERSDPLPIEFARSRGNKSTNMQREVICAVLLFFALVHSASFTPGNFIITYAHSLTDDDTSKAYNVSVEAFTTDGTSVQVLDISPSCLMTSDQYSGAPRLSTDGQHVVFPCYVPSNSSDAVYLQSAAGVLGYNGDLDTSTQFDMGNNILCRAFKHGDSIYFAGGNLVGYSPFGAKDSVINLTPSIRIVQEAFVYDGNLYALNFVGNTWSLSQIGTGTPTTTNQTITVIWTHLLVIFPDTINFFEVDGEKYAYLSKEYPTGIWKLKYENGEWVKKYEVPNQDLLSPLVSSQIYYENGYGTTTMIFTTDKKIYKTIDDGISFSTPTLLVTRSDVIIKGIEWAPRQIIAPEATPVHVDTPADAPIDTPVDAPIDTPIDAPIGTPVDTPINAPVFVPVDPATVPVSEPTRAPVVEPNSDAPMVPLSVEVPASNVSPVHSDTPVKSSNGNTPESSALSAAEALEVEGKLMLLALVLQVIAGL